eukprot:gene918-1000_t
MRRLTNLAIRSGARWQARSFFHRCSAWSNVDSCGSTVLGGEDASATVSDQEKVSDSSSGADALRLNSFIANTGVTSRREAERWVFSSRVTIDGKVCKSPFRVLAEEDLDNIAVDGIPLKRKYTKLAHRPRLWAVNKLKGELVAGEDRNKNRALLLDRMKRCGLREAFNEYGGLFPVFHLDYLSEGLMLLANSGSLAKLLSSSELNLPIHYMVRIHGLVTDSKLHTMQRGITIDGVRYQPTQIAVHNRSHTITWLKVSTVDRKPKAIEKVLQHLHLKPLRLICVGYGPYLSEQIFAGDTNISKELRLTPTLNTHFLRHQNQHHSFQAKVLPIDTLRE